MVEKKSLKGSMGSLMIVFIVLGLGVVLSIATPTFLTSANIMNILRQISVNGLLAIGMSMVALTGGIDLSVGSIVAYAGILTAGMLNYTSLPIGVIVIIAVCIGVIMGVINGYFVAYWNAPPFVVTLAMMTVGRGLTYIFCDGKPISKLPDAFLKIGKGSVIGLPIPFIILMVVFVVFTIMLTKMKHGRYIYAVGGNQQASMVSGINVKRVILSVYLFSGLCCGIAAVVLTARVSAGLPKAGDGYELDAIAATVIGGTSLAGGTGRLWGTMLGVLLLGMVNTGLDLLNVTSYYQQVVKGLIILGAILIDSRRNKIAN
ncbi:MAG: ABC transporter permease [Eubacterium sp.]|nr:ABC transporter permease [Eubacterium sp.]